MRSLERIAYLDAAFYQALRLVSAIAISQMSGMGALWKWSVLPENALAVTALGFWTGLVSGVLSLAGLAFAIIQIARVKRVAVAARDAATAAAGQIATYSVVEECARAETSLDRIQRGLTDSNWLSVRDAYQELIKALLVISNSSSALSQELRESAKNATIDISKLSVGITRSIESGSSNLKASRHFSAVRDYREIVTRTSLAMKREV